MLKTDFYSFPNNSPDPVSYGQFLAQIAGLKHPKRKIGLHHEQRSALVQPSGKLDPSLCLLVTSVWLAGRVPKSILGQSMHM